MKFEIEILDKDLADRELIIKIRAMVEAELEKLSEFSKNNLPNEINYLKGSLESLENRWLKWQKERALNQLSQALNVDRERFGDKEWRDY